MTCRWCERPLLAASTKAFCGLDCANRWAWFGGVRPGEVARRARADRLRRQQREAVEVEQATAEADAA